MPRHGLKDAWADVAYLSGGAHALTAGARHAAAEPSVGSLAAYAHTLTSLYLDMTSQSKKHGSTGKGAAADKANEDDDDDDDDAEVEESKVGLGGRVRVSDLATGFNAARTEEPLSTAERTAVSISAI